MQTVNSLVVLLLVLALVASAGCGDDDGRGAAAPASSGRVVAVQAEDSARSPEAFCDIMPEPAQARRFAMPELDEDVESDASKWRWVNVWATWCAPCIEEIPTLVEWESRYAEEGTPVDLVLLSVDENPDAVQAFRRDHPTVPETARMSDPTAVSEWLESLGMEGGASLPVHILVDPQGRARCLRAGAISDEDYGAVAQLVAG